VTELRHSDVTGDRFWHIAGPLLIGIIGFMIAISTMNTAMRYISLYRHFFRSVITQVYVPHRFFMAQNAVAFVVFLTWVMDTFSQSQSKCAAAVALINTMSSAGLISSSSVHSELVVQPLLMPSQIHLAFQLGTFIRELVYHLHLGKRRVHCDVLGI
jgi:hypothetical protein